MPGERARKKEAAPSDEGLKTEEKPGQKKSEGKY
jgi:hypothetical protein